MPNTTDAHHEIAGRLLTVLPRLQHALKRDRIRTDAEDQTASILSDRRGQYHLLGMLMSHDRMTSQQLADRLEVSAPTVSSMVRSLSEGGLVRRERDDADQRIVWLTLSDEGRRVVEDERRRWRAVFLQRFERLDAADQRLIADAVPALERLLGTEPYACTRKDG